MREHKYRLWTGMEMIEVGRIFFNGDGSIWKVFSFDGQKFKEDEYDLSKLMQFTGLQDRNSVDIYCKDLFKFEGKIYRVEYIDSFMTYAMFTEEQWKWYEEGSNHFKYCYEEDNDDRYFLHELCSYEIEIIGNIHEGVSK